MSARASTAPTEQTAGNDAEPLLDVEDLRTHFLTPRGRVRAVDGVTLTVRKGTALGVVGESGSGKTIFARSIMNLLPQENVVRSGRITFAGRELMDLDSKQMRKLSGVELAMVFQDPMSSLNPVMTIGKQITEPLRQHLRMGRGEAWETAVALLRSTNIPEPERRFDEYPHQLSGGMRQRVMIALALACGPRLLFADEPTTALDVTVQAEILNLLQDQQNDRQMAMVLVTHDLGVVAGRTDEIAVMYAGRIVEQAPTKVLFSRMRHPYTEALLRSIPRVENPSHTRLRVIVGRPPDLVDPPDGCPFAARCPYVHDRCLVEEPPLVDPGGDGHRFACHAPLGTPENAAALEANLERRLPQSMVLLDAPSGPPDTSAAMMGPDAG
ncbi:ABC transporter ATP-binding protein [Ilumatobacter sp.]|uniref:ABC transporter ATP-binding protein n=1 Tax=Ilumatobacter sp. TaxID=1967498 RepID=UPI003B51F0DB